MKNIFFKSNIFTYEVNFETTLCDYTGLSLWIDRRANPVSRFSLIVDLKYVFIRRKLEKVRSAVTVDIKRVIKISRIFFEKIEHLMVLERLVRCVII